jgi:hypothetical protein
VPDVVGEVVGPVVRPFRRPRRGWWAVLVPLFLFSVWVDYALSLGISLFDPALAPIWNTLSQLTIAAGIATIDLYVIYWVVGLGDHAREIGAWMRRAFTGDGLKVMTKCPRCGYEERPPKPSTAERLLRERERAT